MTTLAIGLISTVTLAQGELPEPALSKKDFVIYHSETGKKVKVEDIVADMANYDVLFFGEEHNDSIGHQLQYQLLMLLNAEYGDVALSMEMFDRDVQYIMDEYLEGIIKQSYFEKDSRSWTNYKDYKPMVEYCKASDLDVVCANAAFRYVNVATKHGLEGLMKLSDLAKEAIAPLPYNLADGAYKDKLNAMMGHDPNDTTSAPTYDMIPGQSLWDATMAYSVFEYLAANPDSKVIHLNGRFHTDEGFGIIQRLAEYDSNIKPLIISLDGHVEDWKKADIEDYKHLADYIIFTDPEIAKSY